MLPKRILCSYKTGQKWNVDSAFAIILLSVPFSKHRCLSPCEATATAGERHRNHGLPLSHSRCRCRSPSAGVKGRSDTSTIYLINDILDSQRQLQQEERGGGLWRRQPNESSQCSTFKIYLFSRHKTRRLQILCVRQCNVPMNECFSPRPLLCKRKRVPRYLAMHRLTDVN